MKVLLVPLKYNEINYGGVLQFLALQLALAEIGCDCKILYVKDEKNICFNKPTSLSISIKRKVKKIYKYIEQIYIQCILHNRIIKTNEFKQKYFCDIVNLKDINLHEFDAVICGSDQIWNPSFARRRAFLAFAPTEMNKIIYGASLGVEELSDDQKKSYLPYLKRIQHISVREFSAKKILQEFVECNSIFQVVDPTLLIETHKWENILGDCKEVIGQNKKYVFAYFLGRSSNYKSIILRYAQTRNLQVINIRLASGERIDKESVGDINLINCAPDQFISLIKEAECIFTDSFHAAVFSTIFKKEFFVFERDGNSGMIGRIHTLLELFSLPNRIINSNSDIDSMVGIDYSKIEEIQTKLKEESLSFLRDSLFT